MATNEWSGNTPAVAKVCEVVPANVEIGDEFTLTVELDDGQTRTVSYTAVAATVADVCTGLTALWNAERDPAFSGVTAADGTTLVTLTADSAGVPFSVTGSTVNVGGGVDNQTLTVTTITESAGPNDYNVDANWSLGHVPTAGEDVVKPIGSPAILYGLNQSAVAIASFTREAGDLSQIGREGQTSVSGVAPRFHLRIDTDALVIRGAVGLVLIDVANAAVDPLIELSDLPTGTRPHSVYLAGTNLGTVTVRGGAVLLESGSTVNDAILVSGASVVTVAEGVTLTGADHQVAGAEASVTCHSEAEDIMVHRYGTWTQEGTPWSGTLTMQPECSVFANAAGNYGDIVAFGGHLYTDVTLVPKVIASLTVNSPDFARHDLPGMVTVTALTMNVAPSETSPILVGGARETPGY